MKCLYVIYFVLLFIVLVIGDQEEPGTNGTEYANEIVYILSDSSFVSKMVDS